MKLLAKLCLRYLQRYSRKNMSNFNARALRKTENRMRYVGRKAT